MVLIIVPKIGKDQCNVLHCHHLLGMEETSPTVSALRVADFNYSDIGKLRSLFPKKFLQSTERYICEATSFPDVPGSEAFGCDKARPVESSTVECMTVDWKNMHGDTFAFVDVSGVNGDAFDGKAI